MEEILLNKLGETNQANVPTSYYILVSCGSGLGIARVYLFVR